MRLIKEGDIWVMPSNMIHGVEYLDDVKILEIVSSPLLDDSIGYTEKQTFYEKKRIKICRLSF